MSEEIKDILSSLIAVNGSLNGMREDFVLMKAEQSSTSGAVGILSKKVDRLNNSMIRLEGKSKGLWADIQRVEHSVDSKIHDLKKENLPLLVCHTVANELKTHEDRFIHKQKWNSSIGPPSVPPPSENQGKVSVPKWLFYIGVFFGVSIVAGGAVMAKYIF